MIDISNEFQVQFRPVKQHNDRRECPDGGRICPAYLPFFRRIGRGPTSFGRPTHGACSSLKRKYQCTSS